MTLFPDPAPDLASYDVILVNTSGGKDSQVALGIVHELAAALGISDRVVAVHADLGRSEWPGVPELAQEQAEHYGVRFIKVARTQNDLLDHVRERGLWPSSTTRYCTSDHKRGPVRTVMTRLAREVRCADPERRVRILNVMGFRRDESAARAKRIPFVENGPASNKTVRQVDEWLPIHSWTEDDVWSFIRAGQVRHHWAYDAGMPRLSCCFCVLASEPALILAAQLQPDKAREHLEVEVEIGHRFRDDLSMAQIIDRAAASATPVTIPDWNA